MRAHAGHVLEVYALNLLRLRGGAVREYDDVVVERVRVVARRADAVRRGGAGKDHRAHAEAAQDEIELCLEKGAPARLDDRVVAGRGAQALGLLGAEGAGRHAAPAAEPRVVARAFDVAAVRAVDALDEKDRDALFPGGLDRGGAGRHRGGGARDAVRGIRRDKAVFHIDQNKCGFRVVSHGTVSPPFFMQFSVYQIAGGSASRKKQRFV